MVTLTACVAACTTSPPRTVDEIAADKQIEIAVKQKLADDSSIYAAHIEVNVKRGVVTLSGFVMEAKDLFGATGIAARVPGVTSVNNQMELEVFGRGGKGGG